MCARAPGDATVYRFSGNVTETKRALEPIPMLRQAADQFIVEPFEAMQEPAGLMIDRVLGQHRVGRMPAVPED